MQRILSDRAVSLSDSLGICRETMGARSGLSGQVARHTERSCAITMDRLARGCLEPTVIAHEQKDNFVPNPNRLTPNVCVCVGVWILL